jgi:hypothetical protein
MYGMIAFGMYLVFVAIRWPIERAANARKEGAAAAKRPRLPRNRKRSAPSAALATIATVVPRSEQPQRMRVEPRL